MKANREELDEVLGSLIREDDELGRESLGALLLDALQQAREGNADFAPAPANEVRAKWAELSAGLGLNPDLEHYHKPQRKKTPLRRAALWVAAVTVPAALVVGGMLMHDRLSVKEQPTVAVAAKTSAPAASQSTSTTVAVQEDEVRDITLPDGTVVTLNRNAKLDYNGNREVELSGEAYFKVAKDPECPFVIYTNDLKVTVRGTEFNLNTHTANRMSKLSLYEGRVELEYLTGKYSLGDKGREFVLDNTTGTARVSDFETVQIPQWVDEAPMRIMSLGDILDQIEVRYGVAIDNRGAVDQSRQLRFSVGGELGGVMSRLEYLSDNFSYTTDGQTITLTKNNQ